LENLRLADYKARQGKKRSRGVRLFDRDPEGNLQRLRDAMLAGDYHTSKYTFFKVHDPKERTIARLPYYPDRIVHHAIMNILEPIFTRMYTADTYACIKGRGGHLARHNIMKAMRRDPKGTKYCLKIDIRKYYPSVDRETLKGILRRKFKDVRLLALLDEIIDSAPGLPIGNYLSQTLANVYLAYFDHYVKEQLGARYYFRYVDDIVVLSDDKEKLRSIFSAMRTYLGGRLHLEIKPNWQIFPVEARGLDFLGYVFRHGYVLLRKRIKRNIFRALAHLRKVCKTTKEIRLAVGSYIGWLKYTNSRNLTNTLNAFSYGKVF
jgi:retron-type reverse transcriptase